MRDVDRVGPTAEFMGISDWKLRDMVNKKEIPHFRAGSRIILFRRSSIEEWMEQQEKMAMKQEKGNERIMHLL